MYEPVAHEPLRIIEPQRPERGVMVMGVLDDPEAFRSPLQIMFTFSASLRFEPPVIVSVAPGITVKSLGK
jgi:hypothetical protein